MSHKKASTDPGKDLHLYSRIGMYNEIVFSFFNEDGSDYDFSSVTLEAGVKRNRGDEDLITLTEADGITVIDNDVHLVLDGADSSEFKERPYYWQLRRTIDSKEKVWLNGVHDWHNGKFDAFNNAGEVITITDGSEVVTVTIQESGGSVTLASLGDVLQTADAAIPVDADTFHFWQFLGGVLKQVTWANIVALLAAIFAPKFVFYTFADNGGLLPVAAKAGTLYIAEDDYNSAGGDWIPAGSWFISKVDGASLFSEYSIKL